MAINRNYLGALANSLAGAMTDRFKQEDDRAAQKAYQDYKQGLFDQEQAQLNARNDADNRSAMERLRMQLNANAESDRLNREAEDRRNNIRVNAQRNQGQQKDPKVEQAKSGLEMIRNKALSMLTDRVNAWDDQAQTAFDELNRQYQQYYNYLKANGYGDVYPENLGNSISLPQEDASNMEMLMKAFDRQGYKPEDLSGYDNKMWDSVFNIMVDKVTGNENRVPQNQQQTNTKTGKVNALANGLVGGNVGNEFSAQPSGEQPQIEYVGGIPYMKVPGGWRPVQ